MIPSDHFVRFYNEVFKFLDEVGGLEEYYQEIAHHQEIHCLELFKTKGLRGMYEYWDHIRIEENCELEIKLYPDRLESRMLCCPSLSKVIDNDAGPCEKYCDHCPGWVIPLLEKAGYTVEYNMVDRMKPECGKTIYPASANRPSKVICQPFED